MKTVSMALQSLAAIAVLIAAIPLTLNQLDLRADRQKVLDRAALQGSLGDVAAKAKDHLLAAQAYGDALALDPNNARWRAGLLKANITRIIDDASVIKSDPLRLHAQLADEVTRQAKPSAPLLTAYGRVLQFRGQGEQAVKRFEQAIAADPKFADAHMYLGDAAFKQRKLELASKHLGLALDLKPELAVAKFALGQTRLLQDRTEDAVKLLQEAAAKLPNGKIQLALGRAYTKQEKWPLAERAYERALALDRSLVSAHRPLAEAYMKNKKVEAAAGAFKLAYERARDLEAYRKLGRLFAQSKQFETSLQIFNEIRSLFPDDVESHCQIGNNSFALGQLGIAKAAFERCLTLGEGKEEYRELLKGSKEELGKVADLIMKVEAEQKKAAGKKKKRGG